MEGAAPENHLVPRPVRRLGAMLDRVADVPRRRVIEGMARLLPRWVTPNVLSTLRLVLAGLMAWLLADGRAFAALLVYLAALLTDALDGGVARLRGMRTRFGSRFDPTADKVLHGVLFLAFFQVSPWLLGSLLAMEVLLFLLGLLLTVLPSRRRQDLSASVFGKWKLVFEAAGCGGAFWNALVPSVLVPLGMVHSIFGLALVFAVLSLVSYAHRLTRVVA